MMTDPTVFAAAFAALFAAHQVGDHWVQTDHEAVTKGKPGCAGHFACASHVVNLAVTKLVFLTVLMLATGLRPHVGFLALGLVIDGASHYWADRRHTLAWLADLIPGKSKFYRLGAPRPGHDDNPSIGTGAYALDQSWHIGWLFVAALIISA
ncbi:DUF3307 domain-containing protein [Kineosporia sp. J2-2]|uniref:DUF3307 domain-containing protein n=1 Tax=Kineosporia corallincola TaxID=2835133 RepID=A0ABS5TMF4_9ACTN|nr:DUF3307 domain-containing protein [Kineosporia corallincola]MBT0771356.1 DUF3307 domain-containing protein [Kineosporia corallincola]